MLADTARLAVQLDLKGNFNANLRATQNALKSFDGQVTRTQTRAFRAGQQIGTGIKNSARLIATGAVTVTAALVGMLKVAGDFEAQLNTINTVALASSTDLAKAGDGIRSLAREYGATFAPLSDLTAAEYDLVSAGVQLKDSQAGLTTAVRLGIGAYGSSAEAVDVLTTAINSYNLKAKDGTVRTGAFAKVSDELAQAVADGKVKLSEIASEYATVAPLAAQAGIGTDEIAAALGRVTATGSSAGETLTQMSRAIVELQKPTADLTKLQDKFHKNYAEIAKDKGLNVSLQEMREDAKKAGIPFIDLFGRIEAYKFALNSTGPNAKAFAAELERVRGSAGALDKQVAERTKGLNFQLGRTKALFQDAILTLANPSLPRVAGIFERLNKAISDPSGQANLKAIGEKIAGLFSDQNIQAGIDAIKNGFAIVREAAPILQASAQATLGLVKAAVSVFQTLPDWVQKLAVGAFAVNKLTGGLVTNIVGAIGDILIKQRGSTPFNPLFVVDVSGGAGGLAGAAGGGGIAAALKFGFTTVFLPAVIGTAILGFTTGSGPLGFLSPNARPKDQIKGVNQKALTTGGAKLSSQTGFVLRAAETLAGKAKDDIVNLAQLQKSSLAFLRDQFREMLAHLRGAKTADAITAAIKELELNVFQRGKGGVGGAQATAAALRKALSNTHDPKLTAILRAELRRVEKQVNYRKEVQHQLRKADQIFRSSQGTKQKIEELKAVQRHLNSKDLAAQRVVQQKIDALKKSQLYADHATTQAIKDKDLSTTVNVKTIVPVTVNARDVGTAIGTFAKYFVSGG